MPHKHVCTQKTNKQLMKHATNQQQFPAISQKLKATHTALPPTHKTPTTTLQCQAHKMERFIFIPCHAKDSLDNLPSCTQNTTYHNCKKQTKFQQSDTYLLIWPHNTSQAQNHTMYQQTHHVYVKLHLWSPHKRLVYLRMPHLHLIANIQCTTIMSTTKHFASCS